MAVTDWISNLFQSEQQTRGLSGGTAGSGVALDDSNPYYNYRLRRHTAEGDLVSDPGLLWYTSPYVKRRGGLGTHIAAEKGDGKASFTDVLVILSLEDYSRAVNVQSEPWLQMATRTLLQEFEDFSRREGFERLYAHRQLGFRILCDGSADMGGQALGLQAGEFVTGLLPNLYTGPVRGSAPVIGVHLNLPGVWDGYQEVGRLYNDQILFTLGSHWLDNFAHPALREAALYRLQQYPDGSFVHIVNPDLQDRYQVTSTDQGGASVLTLATRNGEPVAHMVLAVIDSPAAAAPEPIAEGVPGTIPPPMLIDDQVQPVGGGGLRDRKTIIPDAPSERIFTLQERGALLQKVHFANFMQGYDVYLGSRGELGTVVEEKAATLQVRKRDVSLIAHVEGIRLDGHAVAPGIETPLEADVVIEVGGQRLEYRDLREKAASGWPYVGEIRRPASSNYMIWGDTYRVGRSRECRVVLPDEPRNDNISWKPSVGEGATIRARTGEIPKSRFYTDSIMVASEHAAVDLAGEVPRAICQARHCYVYVRRGEDVIALYPTTSGKEPLETDLQPGDELLVGNCLFVVGYTPAGHVAAAPAPAPAVQLSSDALVDAVSNPDFDKLDAPIDAPPPPPRRARGPRPADDEAPSAGGLGEMGMAPRPVPIQRVGMDSILGSFDDLMGDDGSDAPPPPPPLADLDVPPAPPPPPRPLAEEPPPPPEEDEDPTVPGAAVPRAVLEGDRRGRARTVNLYDDEDEDEDEPPPAPKVQVEWDEDDASVAPPPPPPAPDETWEEDDESFWDEDVPEEDEGEAPPKARNVPPPFPDEEDETEAAPPPPPAPAAPEPPAAPMAVEPPPAPEPEPEPAPAAAPAPAPEPEPVAAGGLGEVVWVDDEEAQFELGRRMQVVHVGWMVAGEVVCGNHRGADLILPENRIAPDQTFEPCDYFRIKVRGRRGHIDILSPSELLVDGDDAKEERLENPEESVIEVIRRDDAGDEDFVVRLQLKQDANLPNPRARLLSLDADDDLAAALLTKGLPTRQDRVLEIGGMTLTFHYDGSGVTVSDYLDSYQTSDGFHPFFVQHGDDRFQTAPEDGVTVSLSAGDRLVIGQEVYLIREG